MMKKLMSRLMRLMVLMMLALATMQLSSTDYVCFWLGGAGWVMSGSVMVLKRMMREKEMVLMNKKRCIVVVMNMMWLHAGNVVIFTPSPSRGRL